VLVDAEGRPLCVLTVHAHPDDEASKGAPTMAMYGSSGARTVLVCCTGGEEGDLNNPQLAEPGGPFHGLDDAATRALLAETRRRELAESVRIIGFDRHHMLGYRDSGMEGSPGNDHPECFHRADVDEATGRLVAHIRAERPQVLVTYNDDQRGYPHPDHVKVHEISVRAFARAGDPAWYPEAGAPWAPSKMYYSVWSRARLVAVHEALLARRGSSPYDQGWFDRPDADHRITTRLRVGEWLWARSGALRAHATQVDEREPFWFGLSDEELAEVWPYEDFVLAESRVPRRHGDGELEDDLFAGLRP
jgi:mycothiol S-conjugate amidase